MKKTDLYNLIREFAMKQRGRFNFDKLEKYVIRKEKGFEDFDRLFDLTCESEFLFEDDSDPIEDFFVPRHCFFQGAEFLIKPLPEEVKGGFLLPGHRFIPFVSREVFPAEVTLKLPDGSTSSTRCESFVGQEVMKYLLFFGEFGALTYLVAEDESNAAMFAPPYEQSVNISVFDMQAFYARCGFKSGDSLMLTVEDWLKGIFSVRHISAKGKAVDFALTRDWSDALLASYKELRNEDDLGYDCYEQAARMFWLAEMNEEAPSLITDPPLAFSAFFNMQKNLTIKTMGQLSFFWPKDETVEERMLDLMDNGGSLPESELDAFFQMLNLSVDSEVAEAYIRDALSRDENDMDAVLAHVVSGRTLCFPEKEAQQEFIRLWKDLWDEVREKHDPEKDTLREIRSVFLDLNDQCLRILRELDRNAAEPYDVIGNPDFMQLSELSAMIHQVLVMSINADVDAATAAAAMPMPLDEMRRNLSAVLEDLAVRLPGSVSAKVSEAADCSVYQLKITLKGSKPPIWRRVLVSSGIELEQLHNVIQMAFGWHNCHLHQFVDGREFYQPGGGDDDFFFMMKVEDSNGYRICDLLRREKDKIIYEYDFGDSWEHTVLLEKVLAPDPKQNLPICIKGKRACPPEDCGGIYGYYQLIETLSGPDCEEKQELLEWHGGPIDPEAFDIIAINARLRLPF